MLVTTVVVLIYTCAMVGNGEVASEVFYAI